MVAVGVDGCKGGWIAVAIDDAGACSTHLVRTIDSISATIPDASVIAIDIPVGLVETGERHADREVKALLGPRRSSLFMTPIRAALESTSHAEASSLSVAAGGAGISRQAHGLRARIFEVERWLAHASCPVFEVHPELCFAELRGGRPASAPKKSWHGVRERLDALEAAGIRLDDVDPGVGSIVAVDDLLDAAAAAWTASRLVSGVARSIPERPLQFAGARPIAIWV
jgi:predicted RNase H-like nuclease